MTKNIAPALLALAPLLLGAVKGEPTTPPDPLQLSWLLEQAEAENPSIAMERAAAEAAAHRITPAGALDDPRLSYQAMNLPIDDCDFTPVGTQLWTAHRDGAIRKWFVDTGDLIAAAKARVSRWLSFEERARFAKLLGEAVKED